MTEQTRDEAMRARVAAIDTPTKALVALREVAHISKIFTAEMAAIVGQSAKVIADAIAPPPSELDEPAQRLKAARSKIEAAKVDLAAVRPETIAGAAGGFSVLLNIASGQLRAADLHIEQALSECEPTPNTERT